MNQFIRALSQLATMQAQLNRLHARYLQDAQVDLKVGSDFLERLGAISRDIADHGGVIPRFIAQEFGIYAHSVDRAFYQAKYELQYLVDHGDMAEYQDWFEVYTDLERLTHEYSVWRDILIAQEMREKI